MLGDSQRLLFQRHIHVPTRFLYPNRIRDASEIKQHQKSISLLIFHKLCYSLSSLSVGGSGRLKIHVIFVHSHLARYDAKRQEIEAWLMRMESRSERMGNAAAQADVLDFSVLDSQQKEQKVRCPLFSSRRLILKFMEKDSSSILQTLGHDCLFLSPVFLFAQKHGSIGNSKFMFILYRFDSLWNINDAWWILYLSFFFLLSHLCRVDVPRRITHLQAPHRTFQSINPEAYCRLSGRWHITDKTHDGEC